MEDTQTASAVMDAPAQNAPSASDGMSNAQDRMMGGDIPQYLNDSGSGGFVDTSVGLPMYDENNQRIRSQEQLDAYLSRKGTNGQQVKQPANAQQAQKPAQNSQQAPEQAPAQNTPPEFDSVASMFLADGKLDRNAMLKSVNGLTATDYKPEYMSEYQQRLDKLEADKKAQAQVLEPHEELAKFKSERVQKEIAPLNSLYAKLQQGDVEGAMAELVETYNAKNADLEKEVLKKTLELARGPQTAQQAQFDSEALENAASKSLDTVAHQIFGKVDERSRQAIGEMLFGNPAKKVGGSMDKLIQVMYDCVNDAAKNPDAVLKSDFKTWFMRSIAAKQPRFAILTDTGYKAYNGANLKYYIDGARQSVANQQQRSTQTQQRIPNSSGRPAPAQRSPMSGYFSVEV